MNLKALLLEKKTEILKEWFNLIVETYPPDTVNFIKNQKNQFANPIGHTIFEVIDGLFDEIVNEMNSERVALYLDNLIRVRAIQDFSPSKAINFIFSLKKVIREKVGNEIHEHKMFEELLNLESKIDDLSAVSFDIYMKCREKLYELRAEELKNWTYGLSRKTKT